MQRILGVNLLVCFANDGYGGGVIVLFSDSTIATKIFGVLLCGLLFYCQEFAYYPTFCIFALY